jgi:hypothetical protein
MRITLGHRLILCGPKVPGVFVRLVRTRWKDDVQIMNLGGDVPNKIPNRTVALAKLHQHGSRQCECGRPPKSSQTLLIPIMVLLLRAPPPEHMKIWTQASLDTWKWGGSLLKGISGHPNPKVVVVPPHVPHEISLSKDKAPAICPPSHKEPKIP